MNANRILAIVLAVFAVGYLVYAFQIPRFPLPRPIDSDLFPKVLGFLLLGLSALLYFERPARAEEDAAPADGEAAPPPDPDAPSAVWGWFQVTVTGVAVGLFALLLRPLGFLLASILLVAGLTWFYGYRNHLVNVAVAVAIPLILYLSLTRAMGIYLPPGILPI